MALFLLAILFITLLLYALIRQFRAKRKVLYQTVQELKLLRLKLETKTGELHYYKAAIQRQRYLDIKQAIYWNRVIAKRRRSKN